MKRKIIKINLDKCTGCGACVPDCPEGALQIIDGKARVISDLFCDGLGACIKTCPENAMSIEEREAEKYDEKQVMGNIIKGGANVIKAHLMHLKEHGENKLFDEAINVLKEKNIAVPLLEENTPCGCPGSMMKYMRKNTHTNEKTNNINTVSELANWPIQLKLINPNAPYLKEADIVISADCAPFAYGNFHAKFLQNKILIILCPKLDSDIDIYIEKLSVIFSQSNIKSISIVHMEVPCCGGIEMIVRDAMAKAGRNITIKDYTVSINGELI